MLLLSSNHALTRIFNFFAFSTLSLIVFTIIGCSHEPSSSPDNEEQSETTAQVAEFPKFSTEIKSLSSEELNALGTKNALPTEYIFPNASYVQVVYPERVASIDNGKAALDYLANSTFQLPAGDVLNEADLAIFSRGFTLESLKDAKTNAVLQEGYPSPVEIVYIKNKTPLDQEKLKKEVFKVADESKLKEMKCGEHAVFVFSNPLLVPFDQSGQVVGKIEDMNGGLCFPTEDSVVFMSGSTSAFESYLSDKTGDERGVAAQRLARAVLDNVAVAFQYDLDFSSPNALLLQLPVPLTPELSSAVQKEVTAFQLMFDPISVDGDLLRLNINVKSEEGANDLRKVIGTALMQIIDSLANQQKNTPSTQNNATIDGLIALLKSVQLSTDSAEVIGTIKNSSENLAFISDRIKELNDLRVSSENRQKYQTIEQALVQLGAIFTRYSRENKRFPSAIFAEDGTPLLSWRVAILPYLGDQFKTLYDQFKLDEPWNSDNNIKLLDKIPAIFASSSSEQNKTRFLIFNSPETPFGRAPQGLRLQDVEDPYNTFSVVCSSPANAIEWTKPEDFAFNPSNPSESFGDYVCGITLMGELISSPCDNSETGAKSLASLVFGVSQKEGSGNGSDSDNASDSTEIDKEMTQLSQPTGNEDSVDPSSATKEDTSTSENPE